MLPKINPTKTKSWKKLKAHYRAMKKRPMVDLFRRDAERFSRFSLRFEDIVVDYSKNIITQETLRLLLGLARECKLKEAIEKMFTGDEINETEGRESSRTSYPQSQLWRIALNSASRYQRAMPRSKMALPFGFA